MSLSNSCDKGERAKYSNDSNICSCELKSLPKKFDNVPRQWRGKCEEVFAGLVTFAKEMWTSSIIYPLQVFHSSAVALGL